MKAYIFKMNGRIIDKKELDSCLQYEMDYCDLFMLGKLECFDCSGEDNADMITIEEIEIERRIENERLQTKNTKTNTAFIKSN